MKKAFLLVAIAFWAVFAFSQSQNSLTELFSKNGEIYFTFELESLKSIPDLTRVISIDNRDGNMIFAYANEKEFITFLEMGYQYKILPHPNEGFDPKMATFEEIQNSDALDYYPTYDAYIAMMYQFETNYPTLCDVYSIGQSVNGREILVAKISDNVNTNEAEPEFFYTSSMHGDELTGYPLMLNLIDSLLSQYGSVSRITNLVNNIEIYINPLANPDGTYAGGNHTVSGATRYNANSVDLNRNFPDVIDGLNPNTQPETFLFMNFAESRNFVMSANFHGGIEVCNYPWDHKYALAADDQWWQYVCHEYADTCQAYSPSGYMTAYDDGITNGAAWYVIDGGRQDYMNFYHQCREVTLEISDTKLIPASQLEDHWEYNRRSLLNYMEQVMYGVSGVITDDLTGSPIEAEVYVLNYEINGDSSWVYSEKLTGNYHRLLSAGTYDIQYSAPCYQTQVIQNIVVTNKNTTTVDVQLQPDANAVDFSSNETTVTIDESVYFTDNSCGNPTAWLWSFSGPGTATFVEGTNNTSQNPVVQFDLTGLYDVTLEITTLSGTSTETKTDYINVIDCIYCSTNYSDTGDDWISNVDFNTISNSSVSTTYSDFTTISTSVITESTYNISVDVTVNGSWLQYVRVWIDWNRDCDFVDTGEAFDVGVTPGTSGTHTVSTDITIPGTALFGPTRMRVAERYSQYPGPCDVTTYGEAEDYTLIISNGVHEVDLTVFLEGSFNGTSMNTGLNDLTILPLNQPYNTSPWDYSGTESVGSIPNSNVVDWILVELRDAPTAASATAGTMISKQAAFLLNDGSVVDLDGASILSLDHSIIQSLFVVIWHRNHLGIMSAFPLSETDGTYNYNFTTAASQAYNSGQKNLGSTYGMYGGDANADNWIDDLDKSESWLTEAGLAGYLPSDLNFDGQSDNEDKNNVWLPNSGVNSEVP